MAKDTKEAVFDAARKSPLTLFRTVAEITPLIRPAYYRRFRHRKGRRELACNCPMQDHDDTKMSFTVSESCFYHCFGCGVHGDVIGFLMKCRDLKLHEAVEHVRHRADLHTPLPFRITDKFIQSLNSRGQ